jgi:cytosine/adenosine deaminase-related metal-dependent hydrolase
MRGEPNENGAVVVAGTTVLAVGDFKKIKKDFLVNDFEIVDLGDGLIVPGWVNAHTHLEFSDIEKPLGFPGIKFTDWIRKIVQRRFQAHSHESNTDPASSKSHAIESGLQESILAGTRGIGEIATAPFDINDYTRLKAPIVTRCFLEQLGRDQSHYPHQESELTSFLSQNQLNHQTFKRGASPHAPYSVSGFLFNQIQTISRSAATPVAMHVAETVEERDLLESASGDFVDLLKEFGIWNPADYTGEMNILSILKWLAEAKHALVVHGNYLNEQELDLIASHPEKMSIAFCPRTHRFFKHAEYPLQKMLDRKINICLGTDSRASNPDLNLFKEAQEVASSFPNLSPDAILEMATINGSKALGLPASIGTISADHHASLNFISHPEIPLPIRPTDWMFDEASRCTPVFEVESTI